MELYKYLTGLLLFAVVAPLGIKQKLTLNRVLVFAGLVIAVSAIYQYFFGLRRLAEFLAQNPAPPPFASDYIKFRRAFFPFVTPNTLGGYIGMIIPLALVEKKTRWFIIPIFFALILTKSLGAFLSLFLGLTLYFYFLNKLNKHKIIYLTLTLTVLILIFILRISAQKQNVQPLFSTFMRLNYWAETFRVIKTFFFTGVGLGNFNIPQSRYVHNSFLQIWAEMGIFGLLGFIWLSGSILKPTFKIKQDSIYKNLANCSVASASIFLLHNLVDFTFFLPEVSLIWWVILANGIAPGDVPVSQNQIKQPGQIIE
jgi:putative inorganic carbon (HCO3(-)) transporter